MLLELLKWIRNNMKCEIKEGIIDLEVLSNINEDMLEFILKYDNYDKKKEMIKLCCLPNFSKLSFDFQKKVSEIISKSFIPESVSFVATDINTIENEHYIDILNILSRIENAYQLQCASIIARNRYVLYSTHILDVLSLITKCDDISYVKNMTRAITTIDLINSRCYLNVLNVISDSKDYSDTRVGCLIKLAKNMNIDDRVTQYLFCVISEVNDKQVIPVYEVATDDFLIKTGNWWFVLNKILKSDKEFKWHYIYEVSKNLKLRNNWDKCKQVMNIITNTKKIYQTIAINEATHTMDIDYVHYMDILEILANVNEAYQSKYILKLIKEFSDCKEKECMENLYITSKIIAYTNDKSKVEHIYEFAKLNIQSSVYYEDIIKIVANIESGYQAGLVYEEVTDILSLSGIDVINMPSFLETIRTIATTQDDFNDDKNLKEINNIINTAERTDNPDQVIRSLVKYI